MIDVPMIALYPCMLAYDHLIPINAAPRSHRSPFMVVGTQRSASTLTRCVIRHNAAARRHFVTLEIVVVCVHTFADVYGSFVRWWRRRGRGGAPHLPILGRSIFFLPFLSSFSEKE